MESIVPYTEILNIDDLRDDKPKILDWSALSRLSKKETHRNPLDLQFYWRGCSERRRRRRQSSQQENGIYGTNAVFVNGSESEAS